MKKNLLYLLLASCLFFVSCEQSYIPKQRGFQRIIMPDKKYKPFVSDCGFRCEIPMYATVFPDDNFKEKCWFNIFYAPFNATLHLSYKPVKNKKELDQFVEDSRTLVYKHTVRADEIYEVLIGNAYLNGMLYELSGNTATNFQFYVTDSTSGYIRGALYFNTQTNTDSVAPVLDFIKRDVMHMLQTIRWN